MCDSVFPISLTSLVQQIQIRGIDVIVLVQPRKTRPFITERLLMGSKESNLRIYTFVENQSILVIWGYIAF